MAFTSLKDWYGLKLCRLQALETCMGSHYGVHKLKRLVWVNIKSDLIGDASCCKILRNPLLSLFGFRSNRLEYNFEMENK